MKDIKTKLVTALIIVAVAAGGFWYVSASRSRTVETRPDLGNNQQGDRLETAPKISISQDGLRASYDGQEGKTAMEVLRSLTEVTVEETSFGEMVTSINGKTAESGKEYWAFYVNGSYANEGAGTYKTLTGDKVEWRLEEIQP